MGAEAIGVVLAGGRGRRIGGDKAIVELEGRALIHYVLEALHEVCEDVVVTAKRGTILPSLAGAADLWIEPDEPQHPLCGVEHALGLAAGRPILAVAVDLPLIDAATLGAIAGADPGGAAVVAPLVHGRLQVLCALWLPRALPGLRSAVTGGARATAVAEELGVRAVDGLDPTAFYNVNAPEDLLGAAALLTGESRR
ncbi:molybdenum cofactor guanylyltransferase [Conexibacter woesei]|uniref:molybdenum cofactor guanylyltransferase n=1 Tax=Conexibacter woesei TaxID=191495 RepID=UPI0009DB8051|nr:NTP transferase domain-containing protein [Conexibacter woesei]